MSDKIKLTILVAPLDWGLGHATRCVPIITQLLQIGCKVIIAAEGAQEILLKTEFPDLNFVHLDGYRIKYSKSKRFFSLKIITQLPKIAFAIKREHSWLKRLIAHTPIDAILSDNRYGLYHSKVTSIFITHQLRIKTPFTMTERWLQKVNYNLIGKFNSCWVPDEKGPVNLAGDLSHPPQLPSLPVYYLGGLSRLTQKSTRQLQTDLLVLLSGPEPQRTLLERKLLTTLQDYPGTVLLIRGLPGSNDGYRTRNITVQNHLPARKLDKVISESRYVISRSGYTTIMDLCKLQKLCVLIPTPGQNEQEYLARHLERQGWCIHISQVDFTLQLFLQRIKHFKPTLPSLDMEGYKMVVEHFVKNLLEGKNRV